MAGTRATTILWSAAAAVIVLAGLKLAAALVVPLLLAVFIAMLSGPLVLLLVRRGAPVFAAVGAALAMDLAFFGVLALLLASALNTLASALPRYQRRVSVMVSEGEAWFASHGMEDVGDLLLGAINFNAVASVVASGVQLLAGLVTTLLIVLVIVGFILVEVVGIEEKLGVFFEQQADARERLRRAIDQIQRYVVAKTAVNLLTGVLVFGWLLICRVEFALLWGLSAFVLNYIPTLGAAILAFPVLVVALLDQGLGTTVVVGIGYLIMNIGIFGVIEPRVFGRALGLSPLVAFLSMICWGWLWGPMGAFLSVPLTMMVKLGAEFFGEARWLSRVMDPPSAEAVRSRASWRPGVVLPDEDVRSSGPSLDELAQKAVGDSSAPGSSEAE